ncbi:MAG: hypothetical protein OXB84_02820, partial [Halobacteriovoraceae bacterium]|nr:hypothetical protein [Halobacteriovoraceae bacterium]
MILNEKRTLDRFFLKRVFLSPENNAFGYIKDEVVKYMTYKDYKNIIEKYSLGLKKIGLKKQDKIIIVPQTNNYQWHLLDISIICLGGIVI